MRKSSLLWIGLIVAFAGCGDSDNGRKPDAAIDTGPVVKDAPPVEATPEAGPEAAAEVGRDQALDLGLDTPPQPDGPTGYDVTIEAASEAHGPIFDAQGLDGAVLAPCTGDPSVLIWNDPRYRCGTCGGDIVFPLVCQAGYLACASSYRGSGDVLVAVAKEAIVLDIQNHDQCAFMDPYYYPGFGVADPHDAVTANRDPAAPIKLGAISSYAMLPATFRDVFTDRATGEAVIRSLVTLTDAASGTSVAYKIGTPYVKDTATAQEYLDLTPIQPLAPSTKYRITLYPGTTQQLVKCHTFGRATTTRGTPESALTAPETTDFTTSGQPYDGGSER